MSHEFKICPECQEEYTLVPSECVECGAPLVLAGDLQPVEPPEALPPVAERECVRVGPHPWTRALSDALGEQEIPHRVERDSRPEAEGGIDPRKFDGATVYGTWVRPAERPAAAEVARAIFAHLDVGEVEGPAASEDESCPACEAPLAVDALECPDCGLVLG